MLRRIALGCLVVVTATSLAVAGSDLWLHVYVEGSGHGDETVRVNVPVSLIESVLPLIQHERLRNGKVKVLDELEDEGIDLRAMWEAVRNTPDGEFVRVRGDDENVRVAKAEGMLIVLASDHEDNVNVRIPLEVIDALFSGEGDELDVIAAIRALGRYPGHDVVTVDDGSSKVRIWIDDRQEM